jgi:hypothetical protein
MTSPTLTPPAPPSPVETPAVAQRARRRRWDHHDYYEHGTGAAAAGEYASFVRWLLGGFAALFVAVVAFNVWADPTGALRTTKYTQTKEGAARELKLDLYEQLPKPPEVLLVGSSRTMKVEPSRVRQRTGRRTFNASVSGAVPIDTYLFMRFVADRQDPFPHIVWGMDVDALRDPVREAHAFREPRLRRYATERGLRDRLGQAEDFVQLQTLRLGLSAVTGIGDSAGGSKEKDPAQAAIDDGIFSADGMTTAKYVGQGNRPGQPVEERQLDKYTGIVFVRDKYEGIDAGAARDFERAIRFANEQGDVPAIFVTPVHPKARPLMKRFDYAEREREVLAYLRDAQRRVKFQLHDLTHISSFEGRAEDFYDAVHPTPANTRRMVDHLAAEGAFRG